MSSLILLSGLLQFWLGPVPDKSCFVSNVERVDCIYLINLDQRPEKLDNCLVQLARYKIQAHRFPAIYGWALPMQAFSQVGLRFLPGMSFVNENWPERSQVSLIPGKDNGLIDLTSDFYGRTCFHRVLSPGAVGCSLSHLSVLLDAYNSNLEIIWVLEDDFQIVLDPHLISGCIERLDYLVGRDGWDVLYTDRKCGFNFFEESHDCWRPDMPLFDQRTLLETEDLDGDFLKVGARARTHSMILTRAGIEKILNFMLLRGIFNPYDADIFFVPTIQAYCLKQDVVTWADFGSDTGYKNFN